MAGWLKYLFFNRASDRYFFNEKPLTAWILSQVEGKILAAHCDCMAELGEACSHIAYLHWVISVGWRRTILFGVEKRDSLTVTQKSAYLFMPPAIRLVPVKEIDFIGKKKKAAKGINDDSSNSSRKRKKFDIPTLGEKKVLYSLASSKCARPVVSSALPGYCEKYIPSATMICWSFLVKLV